MSRSPLLCPSVPEPAVRHPGTSAKGMPGRKETGSAITLRAEVLGTPPGKRIWSRVARPIGGYRLGPSQVSPGIQANRWLQAPESPRTARPLYIYTDRASEATA